MSETRALLCRTAAALFAVGSGVPDFGAGWAKLVEAGFDKLLVAESDGGFGGDWSDAFAVLRLAGVHGLTLPIGEAIVAAAAIARAGIVVPEGIIGLADRVEGEWRDGAFTGRLHRVACGRHLDTVVIGIEGRIAMLRVADAVIEVEGVNIAGEPRDTLVFASAAAESAPADDPRPLGAFVRVAQAAGAVDAALAMAIDHANKRHQFGKPLSKLQAVQQILATAATEAAAVNTAGQAAAVALDHGDALLEIAAAKLRTNAAIGICTGIVHQVHGAIGFTEDYPLHHLTRRLMSWRGEFGGDHHWSDLLGALVAREGADGFWHELTRRSDRIGCAPL